MIIEHISLEELNWDALETLGRLDTTQMANHPLQIRVSFMSPLIDQDCKNVVFS